jgi:hypothetical protein
VHSSQLATEQACSIQSDILINQKSPKQTKKEEEEEDLPAQRSFAVIFSFPVA